MCWFFVKQKTAYELRISDWSSDVCSSDLLSAGKKTSRASRMTSDHRKGRMPANITPVGTSRSMPLSTKTFMPTGGVMRLISVIKTTRIPNQIKISPAARSPKSSPENTGYKKGQVRQDERHGGEECGRKSKLGRG